jgi:uncharacterized protein (TIGR02145 family)
MVFIPKKRRNIMITQYHKLALTAGLALAMAFTFSCSGDDGGDNNHGTGTPSSSDNGGLSSSGVSSSGGSSSSSGGGDISIVGCPGAVTGSNTVTCGGKTYATVGIGGKTWMAKNLNYEVSGSKCGSVITGDGTVRDADTPACDTYGRLYDWATAMALPSKCNSTLSTSDAECAITTPNHQGICPSGWHLPSNAEWDALYRSADGTSENDSPYESTTAGKHLKAKEGWTDCGHSGSGKTYSCEDTHNFSALPGGYGFGGIFQYAGIYGYWWSSSEYGSGYAYGRYMDYDNEYATYSYYDKRFLYSVRCLQD